MTEDQMQNAVLARVSDLLDKARTLYGDDIPFVLNNVGVFFDLKGKVAGKACFGTNVEGHKIRFNSYCLRHHFEDFMARTVPHEVAHLVARTITFNQCKPHGKTWQKVMKAFGVKDITRCHNYNVRPARRVRYYSYSCMCRGWKLSSIRHNRVRRGIQVYRCKKCGHPLVRGNFA